jgi:acyl-CoA synthetase (AMP-forming)/AMP-acid ligase II
VNCSVAGPHRGQSERLENAFQGSGKRYFAGGDAVPPACRASLLDASRDRYLKASEPLRLIAATWPCAAGPLGCFGRAVPDVDIAVGDANGDLASLGAEGEMIVRSVANMIGYWKDQGATEQALKGVGCTRGTSSLTSPTASSDFGAARRRWLAAVAQTFHFRRSRPCSTSTPASGKPE